MPSPIFWKHAVALTAASFLSLLVAACGKSAMPSTNAHNPQQQPSTNAVLTQIRITDADRVAAASANHVLAHVFAARKSATRSAQSIVFPADLKFNNGVVVSNASIYNAYVDSGPSSFGNPKDFEQELSRSSLIHLSDEYVNASANNRYDFGAEAAVAYPALTTLGDNDILLIVHAVAAGLAGGGYHHIYNIFLPAGTDYCSTGTLLPLGVCNASSTSLNPQFCGFHGSVVFNDIGKTLFTVQPFQDVTFCGVDNASGDPSQPTPNGLQQDTTYSTLSHEVIETITDPDPGTGWVNALAPAYPSEIGDLCAFIPENTTLDDHLYRIQTEYSNKQHGCNNTPP